MGHLPGFHGYLAGWDAPPAGCALDEQFSRAGCHFAQAG
jgi:hypothetical protein